jgi:hypothetical protein
MVLFFPSSVHATHALAVARISPASWCRAAPAVVITGACLVRCTGSKPCNYRCFPSSDSCLLVSSRAMVLYARHQNPDASMHLSPSSTGASAMVCMAPMGHT